MVGFTFRFTFRFGSSPGPKATQQKPQDIQRPAANCLGHVDLCSGAWSQKTELVKFSRLTQYEF